VHEDEAAKLEREDSGDNSGGGGGACTLWVEFSKLKKKDVGSTCQEPTQKGFRHDERSGSSTTKTTSRTVRSDGVGLAQGGGGKSTVGGNSGRGNSSEISKKCPMKAMRAKEANRRSYVIRWDKKGEREGVAKKYCRLGSTRTPEALKY